MIAVDAERQGANAALASRTNVDGTKNIAGSHQSLFGAVDRIMKRRACLRDERRLNGDDFADLEQITDSGSLVDRRFRQVVIVGPDRWNRVFLKEVDERVQFGLVPDAREQTQVRIRAEGGLGAVGALAAAAAGADRAEAEGLITPVNQQNVHCQSSENCAFT